MMNRNYKKEDYEKIIAEFCNGKPQRYKTYLQRPFLYEADLYNCSVSDLVHIIIELCKKTNDMDTIKVIYRLLAYFFQWSQTEGYIERSQFDQYSEILDEKIVFEHVAENSTLQFLYPSDIDKLCKCVINKQNLKLDMQREMLHGYSIAFLLVALYNGYTLENFINLTNSNVYKHKCWRDDLFNFYYHAYIQNRTGYRYEDYVYQITNRRVSSYDEYKKAAMAQCRSIFKQHIVSMYPKGSINLNTVMYSGFLAYCRSQCESDEEFVTLFKRTPGYKHTIANKKLKEYAANFFVNRKYEKTEEISKLKSLSYILMTKTKWYQNMNNKKK